MELKWLEDFVVLAQVKNFGKAADLRNVSQPAFSRRIQSLELWLGTILIDRACFPMELTSEGILFYDHALNLIGSISSARSILKSGRFSHDVRIEFSAPHNLSLTFFPMWIKGVSHHLASTSLRLKALNVHDAVMTLVSGSSDLLIAYRHPFVPLKLDPAVYESKLLGRERFSLYGLAGKEWWADSGGSDTPFLAYGGGAYLGKIADHIISSLDCCVRLNRVYETDMAEGLKAMMLAGHGIAFLPESSVMKELTEGAVKEVLAFGVIKCDAVLDIMLYRGRPSFIDGAKKTDPVGGDCLTLKRGVIDSLWSRLPIHV